MPPAGGDARPPREDRPHRDEPTLPETVQARDLDKSARVELKSLTKENADVVARHLVMAAQLLEEDAALAHRHALAAVAHAGRIAVVRETLAITAYATGDFALAVRELRTVRRISGSDDQIALLVDSERGLGKPERALETGRSVDRSTLPIEAQVGLAIAMSGARLDLGDPRAALDELERAPLSTDRVFPWSPELFTAFATVHEELGDEREAARWHALAARAADALDAATAEFSEIEVVEEDGGEPEDPQR